MEELLDTEETKKVNHSKRIGLFSLIAFMLIILPTVLLAFDIVSIGAGLPLIISGIMGPLIITTLIIVRTIHLIRKFPNEFSESILSAYSSIPLFIFVILVASLLFIKMSSGVAFEKEDTLIFVGIFLIGSIPATLIYMALKSKKRAVNGKKWKIIIPIGITIIAIEVIAVCYSFSTI